MYVLPCMPDMRQRQNYQVLLACLLDMTQRLQLKSSSMYGRTQYMCPTAGSKNSGHAMLLMTDDYAVLAFSIV